MFQEQLAADVATFLDSAEFAEEVTYNGVQIAAIVETGENMGRGNTFTPDSRGQAARAEIWVSALDVPSPRAGDMIVQASGQEWQVARVLESDSALHRLECIGEESPW